MTYSTRAIILRRRDHGEWDRLYTCSTREHGKLSLLGKGTRRPAAKLAAHLEPYGEVDLVVARGRTIDRITSARVRQLNTTFAMSWELAQRAAFGAECVDALTREGHRDPGLFDLLRAYLDAMASADGDGLRAGFTLRLLSLLGYSPQLDRCLECRGAPGSVAATGFPLRGGIVCHRCLRRSPSDGGILLPPAALRELAACVASFTHSACAPETAAFARGCLAAYLPASLRTLSFAGAMDWTDARTAPTMEVS